MLLLDELLEELLDEELLELLEELLELLAGFSSTGAADLVWELAVGLVLSDAGDFLLLADCGLLLTDKLKKVPVSFCSTTARSFSSGSWFSWILTGLFR